MRAGETNRRSLGMKDIREQRRRNGLCPNCGRTRWYDDVIICRVCRTSSRKSSAKATTEQKRRWAKNSRDKRKREGLCPNCGHERDDNGCKQCNNCLRRQHECYIRNAVAKKIRKINRDMGLAP